MYHLQGGLTGRREVFLLRLIAVRTETARLSERNMLTGLCARRLAPPWPRSDRKNPNIFVRVHAVARAYLAPPAVLCLSLFLIIILSPLPSQAQNTKIVGQIRLAGGGTEDGGATVMLYNSHEGLADRTVSDTKGQFYFLGISVGEYTIEVSKPGYHTSSQRLRISFAMPEQYVTVFISPEEKAPDSKGGSTVSAAELALPSNTREEFEKGRSALRKDKYKSAIQHLKAVVEAQPHFALGFEVLGVAYLRSGDAAEAESAFQRALTLDAKRPECYIQLGLLNYEQKRFPESKNFLEKGLGLNQQSWFGHFQLGLTLFLLQNYAESEKEFHNAQELNPSFAEIHIRLANVYLRQQKPAKALAEFENYLEKDPKGRFVPPVRRVVDEMRKAGIPPSS